jgi:hypothetical protein
MSSNLYHHFMTRTEALRSTDPSAGILVELQGKKAEPTTSVAEHGTHGVFYVRQFSPASMQHGKCSIGEVQSG